MNQTIQAKAAEKSKRDTTALALLGVMFVVLAIVCAATFYAVGSGGLQEVMNAIGFGRFTVIEAEQRRQATALAALQPMIDRMAADVGALNRRAKTANHENLAVGDRFAHVDADIADLAAEIQGMRTARAEPGSEPWSEPVSRLDGALSATNADVLALRSSLDEQGHSLDKQIGAVRNEVGAVTKDIGAITKRLDRLEQTVSRDLTGSIHASVRKRLVRRKPRVRPIAAPSTVAAPRTVFVPQEEY